MDNKVRIYYKKDTGFLCERYPYDLKVDDGDPCIDVSDDEYQKTLVSSSEFRWAVVNGKLAQVEDAIYKASDAYKEMTKRNRIAECKGYLDSTDYVITKLQEISLTGTDAEFTAAKASYKDVLDKRKACREELSSLQG